MIWIIALIVNAQMSNCQKECTEEKQAIKELADNVKTMTKESERLEKSLLKAEEDITKLNEKRDEDKTNKDVFTEKMEEKIKSLKASHDTELIEKKTVITTLKGQVRELEDKLKELGKAEAAKMKEDQKTFKLIEKKTEDLYKLTEKCQLD